MFLRLNEAFDIILAAFKKTNNREVLDSVDKSKISDLFYIGDTYVQRDIYEDGKLISADYKDAEYMSNIN